jgi:hypothetical protein
VHTLDAQELQVLIVEALEGHQLLQEGDEGTGVVLVRPGKVDVLQEQDLTNNTVTNNMTTKTTVCCEQHTTYGYVGLRSGALKLHGTARG